MTVRPAAGVVPGRYEEALTLHTDSPTAAHLELPVHLFVKADLYAEPDAVDFGTVPLEQVRRSGAGELFAQTLVVKRRDGSFEITSVACDLPAVAVMRSPERAERPLPDRRAPAPRDGATREAGGEDPDCDERPTLPRARRAGPGRSAVGSRTSRVRARVRAQRDGRRRRRKNAPGRPATSRTTGRGPQEARPGSGPTPALALKFRAGLPKVYRGETDLSCATQAV